MNLPSHSTAIRVGKHGRLTAPLADRFWPKVEKTAHCWEWRGAKSRDGYGYFSVAPKTMRYAHRVAFELLVGPIPDGMQLDHLCRNRACVRPDHLEPVTGRENRLRGSGFVAEKAQQTHCIHGHLLDEANTYIRPSNGTRHCRECNRVKAQLLRDRKQIAVESPR